MRILIALLMPALLVGCATPTVVDTRQSGDPQLTCQQIQRELDEAQRFEDAARKDRGVTGTNVAAAILFWPALLGTYSNTEEAIEAARKRKEVLMKMADKKDCNL